MIKYLNQIKKYKTHHYILGIFGSFAVVNMIILFVGLFGALYHSQYHASAGPAYINPSNCSIVTQIPQNDCTALVDLYNSTDGEHWINSTNRGNFPDISTWHGVDVIGGRVKNILLGANNLSGDIPASIRFLTGLDMLHLEFNNITSIDDAISDLHHNLTELYVNNNQLTELPLHISVLDQLLKINASHNMLPKESFSLLFPLENIQRIKFDHNLVDRVESSYGDRTLPDTLQYLDLSYNQIREFIHITKYPSTKLTELYLAHNQIDQTPDDITNLSELLILDLGKNLLGSEDFNQVPYIIPLSHLYINNNLIGNIPDSFDNFSKNNNLQVLDMSYNKIDEIFYIDQIGSLTHINLANNNIGKMIPLDALVNLKALDMGFNKIDGDLDTIIKELLKRKTTLTNFSLRANNLNKQIPKNIVDLFLIEDKGCQLDYNRLDVQADDMVDPGAINYLNNKCIDSSSSESYKNTDRKNQYTNIETTVYATLDTVGDIYPGDEIEITVTIANKGDKDTDSLDLSIYDNSGVFSIIDPTDGFSMIKDKKFDNNDPCKIDLTDNDTGVYVSALNARSTNNGRLGFLPYLQSLYRDYDLYALGEYNPYPTLRGTAFVTWIEQYSYNAFDSSFQGGLNTRLFNIDINDLAIEGCGIDGKNVTSYNQNLLAEGEERKIVYTIKIDDTYVGNFNLRSLLESDNRLFIEGNPGDNTNNLNIIVKGIPIDTDGDGISDSTDNCPWVANPLQEDSNAIIAPTVDFIKIDRADYTLTENQDCINSGVCITRADKGPLFNSLTQTSGDVFNDCSANPYGTEWATGVCADYTSLIFGNLFDVNECYPPSMIGEDMCLHTISDDKYYDIVFSDWTQGVWGSPPGSGGGFAYSRTEYLFVTNTGDACDCTDSICTTGNDYTGNLICTPVDPACSTTPPIIIPPAPPGGGSPSFLHKDDCPDGDFSPSYYDDTCEGTHGITTTEIIRDCSTEGSTYSTEMDNAFQYTCELGMTEELSIQKEEIDEYITRKYAAKMISIFAIQELGKRPDEERECEFSDIKNQPKELQGFIKLSCELGIMGLKKNGAPDTIFNPNNFITRAQFGTMLSRLLYDGAYNVPLDSKSLWYQEHLEALQENNIMTKISSPMTRKEIKGWIILMMYRIANK